MYKIATEVNFGQTRSIQRVGNSARHERPCGREGLLGLLDSEETFLPIMVGFAERIAAPSAAEWRETR